MGMTGETIDYQKFSDTFVGIPVGDTIYNTEKVAKEYADVLEKWRQDIIAACSVSDERLEQAVVKYLDEHPGNVLTVTFDEATQTASHNAAEIRSHVFENNGTAVFKMSESMASGVLPFVEMLDGLAVFSGTAYYNNGNDVVPAVYYVAIAEDKSMLPQVFGIPQSDGAGTANITINGIGPDENGNFIISTVSDAEIAQLTAALV